MSQAERNEAEPPTEGFREPPERITEPCLTYMARIMELRSFVSYYFNFVKTSHQLAKLIPTEAKEAASASQLQILQYNYSAQRPLVNQIMLSRATESFD